MGYKDILSNLLKSVFRNNNSNQRNSFAPGAFRGVNNRGNTGLDSLNVGLNADGSIRVGLNTYFSLIKKNATIGAGLRFMSQKVGGYGFYFTDSKGNEIKGQDKNKELVKQFFSKPNMRAYIYESIAHFIIAGQKISTATLLNKFGKTTPGSKINILDPRMVTIKLNDDGSISSYIYRNKLKEIPLDPAIVNDDILYPDLDIDHKGQSQMDSIVIDALTDVTMGSRQFHFYRNNATPGTVFILDGEIADTEEKVKLLETKAYEKFGGNANNGKPLISNAIKDVKTIEIPDIKVIEERELIMKILTMVIGVDPRVLGYMKETGGSYAEIDAIARGMTNAKLEERTTIIENNMNDEYNKFNKELPYRIKLDTIYFKNIENDKKMSLEEVKAGIMSTDEYKALYNI